jgi:hypothetical protein
MDSKEVRRITLGERRRGITVTDENGSEWHLRVDAKFAVLQESAYSVVLLSKARRFRLLNIEGNVYLELYGNRFLFSPFLRIGWLRDMLHYHGE